jgi:TolB protein
LVALEVKTVALSALALCIGVLATGADAAPSLEPRIAFWRLESLGVFNRIYTVRPDGSRLRRLPFRARRTLTSPAWSPDGRRLAFVAQRGCRRVDICWDIWTSEPNGRRLRRVVTGCRERDECFGDDSPAWSPDGRTIAFDRGSRGDRFEHRSIHAVGIDGRGLRQLTRDHYDEDPAWSPDGQTVLFSREPPVEHEIQWHYAALMLMNADGSGVRAFPGGIRGREPAWAPSGRQIAFISHQHRNGVRCIKDDCWASGELYVVNADGTGLKRLSRTAADERSPTWSPDGKWIAYSRGYRLHGFRRYRIFRIRPNGEGRRLVVEMDRSLYDPAWRPR